MRGYPENFKPGEGIWANLLCASCRERLATGEELPQRRRKMRVVDLPVSATGIG